MNLKEYTNFHFIGIGGMGMRALAEILLEKGYSVSGSDMADSPVLENFRKRGASIFIGHDASHVKGEGCVVISSAISEDNPELMEARRKQIPVFHRSDVLAALLLAGKGISVAGAHGKSTTSGMLGQIFTKPPWTRPSCWAPLLIISMGILSAVKESMSSPKPMKATAPF